MRNFKSFLSEEEMSEQDLIRTMEIVSKSQPTSLTSTMHGGKFQVGSRLQINDSCIDEDGNFLVPLSSCVKITVLTENLTSFKNFPETIGVKQTFGMVMALNFQRTCSISSLEGFPKLSNGDLELKPVVKISYSRCNKFMEEVKGKVAIREGYVGPVLSFILVKSLWQVDISEVGSSSAICKVDSILNKHLRRTRDIIDCKEELMTAGLKEYAKL